MPKTITVRLNSKSISAAVTEIRNYALSLNRKADWFVSELAEIGKATAEPAFMSPEGENEPCTVYVERQGEGNAAVIADGESAVFVEFGAGIGVNNHPQAGEFGFYDGSYSQSVGGMYSKKGFWKYNGKGYMAIMAGKGMYYAAKQMRQELEPTARKVFAND